MTARSDRVLTHAWLAPTGMGLAAAFAACATTLPQQLAASGILLACLAGGVVLASRTHWVAAFLIAALCLPPLPFAIGDSGPHPALAFLALGIAAGLIRWKQWTKPVPLESLALLVFPLILLAGIPLAALYSGTALAIQSMARVMLFTACVYVFFYVASGPGEPSRQSAERHLRVIFSAGVASALFACVDFYYQFPAPAGFGPQYIWLDSGVFRRAQGLFYEASTLGNVCAFFLVFAAAGLLDRERRLPFRKVWLVAGGIPIAAAFLLSYSRASLLNVGVSLCALALLNAAKLRLARIAGILSAAIATTLAITYALVPVFVEFYWLRITTSLDQLMAGNEQLLSGRLQTWQTLTEFLAGNPWHALLGIGYKTLPYSDFTGGPLIADNTYLSSLVETGILGFAGLLALHVAVLRMSWRAHKAGGLAGLLGTWVFCFWTGEIVQMMSGDLLTYWRVLPIYFCVLALAVRLSSHEPPA